MDRDEELEFVSGGSGSESDENFSDATAAVDSGGDAVNENPVTLNYPLHKAAFKGDRVELTRLLRKGCDVAQKDIHGI